MIGAIPEIANLSDPAAIAAARHALDEAERRAEAEAAAAKQRAHVEAQQAEEDAFQCEVDASSGPWEPVAAARQVLAEAQARVRSVEAAVAAAQKIVDQAREQLPALIDRALAGEAVSPEDVAAAHAAVGKAEQFAAFSSVVLSRHALEVPPAEAALKAAIADAHLGVYERGIALRIEAATAADAAKEAVNKSWPIRAPDRSAMDAAFSLFERGNRLIRYACSLGVRFTRDAGFDTYWPTSERAERRRWKRPAEGAP